MKYKSIFKKLLTSYCIIIVVFMGFFIPLGVFTFRMQTYEATIKELQDLVSLIDTLLSLPSIEKSSVFEYVQNLGETRSFRITLITKDGTVLADSRADPATLDDHSRRPEVISALTKGEGRAVRYSVSIQEEMVYYAQRKQLDTGELVIVRAALPLHLLNQEIRRFYLRFFLLMLLIGGISFLLAWYLSRSIEGPIKKLTDLARDFSKGASLSPIYLEGPEELQTLAYTLNTMAEEIEKRIQESTRRREEIETIFTCMREGVIVLDQHLRVYQANRAAFLMVGKTEVPADFVGSPLLELFPLSELKTFVDQMLQHNTSFEGTVSSWDRNQKKFQVYGAPLLNSQRYILVLHDITHLSRLEQIRKDFVANVSHELRTPITSIKGFVETLQDGAGEDPQLRRRYLDIIARHTIRMEHIIEDLLSLARIEQQEGRVLDTEDTNLNAMLKEVIELFEPPAKEKNIEVILSCPQGLTLKLNPSLFEQALANLLDNAIKYSPPDTRTTIEVRDLPAEIQILFRDEGNGIPARDLDRIFERFYRVDKSRSREAGGTGLGLSIVKHVVQLHGGTVSVHSVEGVGSTFTIHLPKKLDQVLE
ncbi:MAG TPA: ATP-binding protein [Termitinemataceae bacterium]|nr:ATP-binding protein [Termitinemataceae bacterium]HOM24159.1 ATP-binding protein [Termitinemataceae bacterium]HPQ01180.1 ATP-binding protein [Termitinemataceae bacterium]